MIEVHFHGRGGREAKTASRIVGRNGFVPHEFKPVEELLAHQSRFRHLFKPYRDDDTIGRIRATVDNYWKTVSEKVSPTLCRQPTEVTK